MKETKHDWSRADAMTDEDMHAATLDDPDAYPAGAHIQTAERLTWMENAHALPAFERFPPQG